MSEQIIVNLINFYQRTLSPDHGPSRVFGGTCRFYPTCSEYTKEAVTKHGAIQGLVLGVRRIAKCQPFQEGGFDPVPARPVASSQKLGALS